MSLLFILLTCTKVSLNIKYILYYQPPGCVLRSHSQLPLPTFYYVNLNMNWTNAQQYCRVNYNDLATFNSKNDISMLKPDFSYSLAWTGLRGTPVNDSSYWTWSTLVPMGRNYYFSWFDGEPHIGLGDDNCAVMETHGKWMIVSCSSLNNFVCYNGKKRNYWWFHKKAIYLIISKWLSRINIFSSTVLIGKKKESE